MYVATYYYDSTYINIIIFHEPEYSLNLVYMLYRIEVILLEHVYNHVFVI